MATFVASGVSRQASVTTQCPLFSDRGKLTDIELVPGCDSQTRSMIALGEVGKSFEQPVLMGALVCDASEAIDSSE